MGDWIQLGEEASARLFDDGVLHIRDEANRFAVLGKAEVDNLRALLERKASALPGCGAGRSDAHWCALDKCQPDGKPEPAPVESRVGVLEIECPHCRTPADRACTKDGVVCAVRVRTAREACRSCKGDGLVRVLVPGVVGSYQIHRRCRDCSGTGKTP